jgi:hypothetical protein
MLDKGVASVFAGSTKFDGGAAVGGTSSWLRLLKILIASGPPVYLIDSPLIDFMRCAG